MSRHELPAPSIPVVDEIVATLTGMVETAWTEVARVHRRAGDGRCGTCGDRSPCRAYREATRSGRGPVEPVQR
jgi:hypothetical protein